jgi:hypothetical protein
MLRRLLLYLITKSSNVRLKIVYDNEFKEKINIAKTIPDITELKDKNLIKPM